MSRRTTKTPASRPTPANLASGFEQVPVGALQSVLLGLRGGRRADVARLRKADLVRGIVQLVTTDCTGRLRECQAARRQAVRVVRTSARPLSAVRGRLGAAPVFGAIPVAPPPPAVRRISPTGAASRASLLGEIQRGRALRATGGPRRQSPTQGSDLQAIMARAMARRRSALEQRRTRRRRRIAQTKRRRAKKTTTLRTRKVSRRTSTTRRPRQTTTKRRVVRRKKTTARRTRRRK